MFLSRRHFFLGSLALPVFAEKKAPPPRPHVLMLLADNLPQWVLGVYGNKEIRTPNIDRFAQVGVRFLGNFSSAPSPTPGRASLLTGMAPGLPGATIDKTFAAAGYACNSADATTAARYIDAAAPGKPMFLTVNLTSPRPPYDNLAEKYRDLYAQTRFDTFNPEPAADNIKSGKDLLADTIGSLRKYAAAVSALDDEVGAVLGLVAQRKLGDQTLVIFTSTCGALLSHHGLWDAGEGSDPVNMYDESVATPLIWSWPMRLPPATQRPEVVSAYDVAPTVCDLLSLERPAGNLCGRSYALIAAGKPLPKKERWQSAVFAHLGNTWMARAERYKLVARDGGPGELYDIQVDPAEKTNQFDNPQFTTVKGMLTTALNDWRKKYSG
jgi:arylsulfatase A-like enzyme